MRTETHILIAEMERQLNERKYFSTQEIVQNFPVSVKTLNNKRVLEFKKVNNIVHLYSGIHCREQDVEYVSEVHPDRMYKPELEDSDIEEKILSLKKEFMISSLTLLFGKKNKDRILPLINRLLDRGLIEEIFSMYGRSNDPYRKLYFVTSCEDLIGGMSIQEPSTRSLDHYRKILLGFKKADQPFSVRDIEDLSQGINGKCINEIQRLMHGGFLMFNNDIRKYEFIR